MVYNLRKIQRSSKKCRIEFTLWELKLLIYRRSFTAVFFGIIKRDYTCLVVDSIYSILIVTIYVNKNIEVSKFQKKLHKTIIFAYFYRKGSKNAFTVRQLSLYIIYDFFK